MSAENPVQSNPDIEKGEVTFLMLKPDSVQNGHKEDLLEELRMCGLEIVLISDEKVLSKEEIHRIYPEVRGHDFETEIIDFLTSGPCIGVIARSEDALRCGRLAIGHVEYAEIGRPASGLRAKYGSTHVRNAIHAASTNQEAWVGLNVFF